MGTLNLGMTLKEIGYLASDVKKNISLMKKYMLRPSPVLTKWHVTSSISTAAATKSVV